MAQAPQFVRPPLIDRIFNRCFAVAIGLGIGLAHNYVLEVRGRKSGRIYSAPVDLLEFEGRRYLVAPRGETQWVRNARAAGRVTLRQGRRSADHAVREVGLAERPALLKAYLDRFAMTVQRFFPIHRESPVSDFTPLAPRYPVFEVLPAGNARADA